MKNSFYIFSIALLFVSAASHADDVNSEWKSLGNQETVWAYSVLKSDSFLAQANQSGQGVLSLLR